MATGTTKDLDKETYDLLVACMGQFYAYEQAHRAKGTPESLQKAIVNGGYATAIQRHLDLYRRVA
jgi:hypothetical protein